MSLNEMNILDMFRFLKRINCISNKKWRANAFFEFIRFESTVVANLTQ